MRIDVALVPAETKRWRTGVAIVVDQLRASSNIVTLLAGGAEAVVPAGSLAEARRLGRAHGPGAMLAGERHVVRPPGFDLGNSIAEAARADLAGRTVFLSTRNGTAVLRSLPGGMTTFIGCMRNATAVAKAALEAAGDQRPIGIVCAGRLRAFAMDDALAAGCILDRLLGLAGAGDAPLRAADPVSDASLGVDTGSGARISITDAGRAVLQLWRTTPDPAEALRRTWSGHLVASYDFHEDLEMSAEVDAVSIAPVVVPGSPARIVARA